MKFSSRSGLSELKMEISDELLRHLSSDQKQMMHSQFHQLLILFERIVYKLVSDHEYGAWYFMHLSEKLRNFEIEYDNHIFDSMLDELLNIIGYKFDPKQLTSGLENERLSDIFSDFLNSLFDEDE